MTDQSELRGRLLALVEQMCALQTARARVVAAAEGATSTELLAVTEAIDAIVQRLDKEATTVEEAANLDERSYRPMTGSKPNPRL